MKKIATMAAAAACAVALAAPSEGVREAFLKQQAYEEMSRVAGQIDALQQSHEELAERVARIDGGKGDIAAVKADVESLRAEIDGLRREMRRMKQEIVEEMTKKVIEVVKANNAATARAATPPPAPRPAPRPANPAPASGQYLEYTVKSGDNLYLIAQVFSTSVAKVKEINGLKSDKLSIGQKLLVPKVQR